LRVCEVLEAFARVRGFRFRWVGGVSGLRGFRSFWDVLLDLEGLEFDGLGFRFILRFVRLYKISEGFTRLRGFRF